MIYDNFSIKRTRLKGFNPLTRGFETAEGAVVKQRARRGYWTFIGFFLCELCIEPLRSLRFHRICKLLSPPRREDAKKR